MLPLTLLPLQTRRPLLMADATRSEALMPDQTLFDVVSSRKSSQMLGVPEM